MTRRSKPLSITAGHVRLAAGMAGLSAVVLLGPPRARPLAGLALGALIARGQADAIATVHAGALAAAERGGARHARHESALALLVQRLDVLESREQPHRRARPRPDCEPLS